MHDDRIVTSDELKEDCLDLSIRPLTLKEYIGQSDIKENLEVFNTLDILSEVLADFIRSES